MATRLAVLSTHPIQYNAPVFRELATFNDIQSRVYYGWKGPTAVTIDPGFGQNIEWDIPLLDGYEFEFVENVAKDPGSDHFRGIDLPTLQERITAWKPTAILIYGWCYKSHLQAIRFFRGKIPILFRGDSTLLGERPGLRRLIRRRILRWVYRHIDVGLYVGTNNREYFLKHGLRSDQLVFAPHAVENARFESFCRDEATQIRNQLGIGHEDTVLLFAGKLDPIKAPEQLLNAFRNVSRRNHHLVFAGSGVMEAELRTLPCKNVHFLGFQNQSKMPAIYGAADLLALPSRSETWGLALNEAMAAGCAVLASDRVGAAIDLVQPGRNGWISKAGDQDSLARCLQDAFSHDRTYLQEMGRQSHQLIQPWSIEAQARAIGEVVRRHAK